VEAQNILENILWIDMNKQYEVNKFYSHIVTDYITDVDGCWEMDTYHDKDGYPSFSISEYHTTRACRISYLLFIGDIPDGMQIRHICHNSKCVNPNHLLYGTSLDNNRDKVLADRQAKGSVNGNSELIEDDVIEMIIDVWNDKYLNFYQIAEVYNVQHQTIGNIFTGLNWTHITNQLVIPLNVICSKLSGRSRIKGQQKLVDADIRIIRSRIANGESNASIARDFSIDPSRISNIKTNKAWKHVL